MRPLKRITLLAALLSFLAPEFAEAKPRRLIAKCKTGDMKACFDLAVAYENGDLAKTDVVKARELYTTACDADHAEACANLAVLWQVGDGGPENADTALKLHTRACFLGSASACRAAGRLYGKQKGAAANAKAGFLRGAGCNLGNARACFDLAYPVQSTRPELAQKLYRTACAMGQSSVCSQLGITADAARKAIVGKEQDGTWRPIDPLGWITGTWAGTAASETACTTQTKDGTGCWHAALGHWLGWDGPTSSKKAVAAAQKACSRNHGLGCLLAGWASVTKGGSSAAQGKTWLDKACGLKVPAACPK